MGAQHGNNYNKFVIFWIGIVALNEYSSNITMPVCEQTTKKQRNKLCSICIPTATFPVHRSLTAAEFK
jgi:hypothetical protein